jgi:hypothetical protein
MTFLLLPLEGDGLTHLTGFRPKYIPALGVSFASIAFDGNSLVSATLTAQQETDIALNADVILIPPLDNTVAVTATKNSLEAINIPAQWVTAGMTYRQVLKVVAGLFLLLQRINGRSALLHLAGNLDKTLAQIPANTCAQLANASDDLGLDRSAVTNSTTVREALRIAGQQFQTFDFGSL